MMTIALAPSLTPEAFPAVTLPVFGRKAGGRAARSAAVRPGRLAALLGDLHGDDLCLEIPFPGGPFGVVVAPEGHRVDLLPGEVVHLGDQFGGDPHDVRFAAEEFHDAPFLDRPFFQAGQEVRARMEAVDDVVHEDLILKAAAPPGAGNGIGDPRHVLHAAGEDDIRHVGLDHRHPRDDGLHSGDADPVDRDGCNGIGDAGQKGGDACDVEGVHRLHAAAEADIVDESGVDPGPADGLLHDDAAQRGAVHVAQCSAERADGGPTGRYDHTVFHRVPPEVSECAGAALCAS
jgi:hypothetical protein